MDDKQDTGHSPRLPERRHPAHGVKSEFGTPVIVFVTICTKDRKPWLANDDVHQLLRSVWMELDDWLVGRYVLMPEHIHLFAGRAKETSLDRWLKYWKADFTRRHGNPEHRWQSGHWDTRLRPHESYDAKWDYVRNNPVRHGLVTHVDDWPFQGRLNPLPWWQPAARVRDSRQDAGATWSRRRPTLCCFSRGFSRQAGSQSAGRARFHLPSSSCGIILAGVGTMRSAKVRPDYSVELPEELRSSLRPSESLDVMVTGERVTYARRRRRGRMSMGEVIERIRRNPPAERLSDSEIEDMIRQVRQERS